MLIFFLWKITCDQQVRPEIFLLEIRVNHNFYGVHVFKGYL
jgi:hypothetical protein